MGPHFLLTDDRNVGPAAARETATLDHGACGHECSVTVRTHLGPRHPSTARPRADVNGRTGDHGPIEVHLPDGGHVIVSFADAAVADSGGVVDTLLTGDTERDVERAIVDDLKGSDLTCTVSPGHHPTVIVIGRR